MKASSIAIAVFLALFVLAFLSGCLALLFKDCGNDPACFEAAALKCEKAKVTIVRQDPLEGSFSAYLESRGFLEDSCLYYLRVDKLEFVEDETTTDLQKQIYALFKTLQGKSAICTIPEIESDKRLLVTGDFSEMKAYCSGSLIDQYAQVQTEINTVLG